MTGTCNGYTEEEMGMLPEEQDIGDAFGPIVMTACLLLGVLVALTAILIGF